jgi:hypothetical protein
MSSLRIPRLIAFRVAVSNPWPHVMPSVGQAVGIKMMRRSGSQRDPDLQFDAGNCFQPMILFEPRVGQQSGLLGSWLLALAAACAAVWAAGLAATIGAAVSAICGLDLL